VLPAFCNELLIYVLKMVYPLIIIACEKIFLMEIFKNRKFNYRKVRIIYFTFALNGYWKIYFIYGYIEHIG